MNRVHITDIPIPGQLTQLPSEAAHHLIRVLRLKAGAQIILFVGNGREWPAEIIEASRRKTTVIATDPVDADRECGLDISLVQAIGKGQRMDYSIQKAVELGVNKIIPVFSQRSVVKLDEKRKNSKTEHWQGVAIAACEQCGRNRVPDVTAPKKLLEYLLNNPLHQDELGLFLDPRGQQSLQQHAQPSSIRILIGPEGGFTDEELRVAEDNGYQPVRLGKRILRTETAGPAVIAAIQTLWGDFND